MTTSTIGTKYQNKRICPEDEIGVVLPAEMIPDGATVTKRNGEQRFTLKHNLIVYGSPGSDVPLKIEGYFLVGDRGSINQVTAGKRYCWITTADDFVDSLQRSWEGTPQ